MLMNIAIRLALKIILCALVVPLTAGSQTPKRSRYVDPAVYDGLFYIVSGDWQNDLRALVISYSDDPIGPKANDPEAPTTPGFYPSPGKRFDFVKIEVVRRKISFKTQSIDGVSYIFCGETGKEVVKGFDPSILVPYITGSLLTLRNGKIVKRENVKFGHAVIA